MMLRVWWLGLLVLCWAGAVRAQQGMEGPPVPPETESAVRSRAAAGSGKTSAAVSGATAPASPSASSQPMAPNPPPGGEAAPTDSPASEKSAVAPTPASDSLRAFPPAPPPAEPGPAQPPTAALTSFAPAPEPPPGGAPSVPTTSPSNTPATPAVAATSASTASAATSGNEENPYTPSNETRWTASALAGVGVTFDNTIAGVNPMGFGFGVRGDYRLLPSFSIGARMLYFVGGSVELPTSDVAMQSWLIAAEAAYVIETDDIVIQPGIALGLHVRETDYRGFGGLLGGPEMLIPPGSTSLGLYVAPGVNVSLPLGLASPSLEPLIAGADFRLDLAFGNSVSCNVQLLVLAGFQF